MPRARKKQKGWSYLAGAKGKNRVRVYLGRSGVIFIQHQDGGTKVSRSLGHSDRDRAEREADEFAAKLRQPDRREAITLGKLFDIYEREVSPKKGQSAQYHDQRVIELCRKFFGGERLAESLNNRDAAYYMVERKKIGDLRLRAKPKKGEKRVHHPVGQRLVASDLKLLKAILNWGVGADLLDRNPIAKYKVVEDGTPRRPVFTGPQYLALLAVAPTFPWQFTCLLRLAHETGHRLGALVSLQWRDVDLMTGRITWRGESDKIRYEHTTPMTDEARAALVDARERTPGIGDTPVVPTPRDRSEPVARHLARDWLQRAQLMAGLTPEHGRGWHAFRRNFASELRHVPLRDLCDLGGWKDYHTVIKCYQGPNEETMRKAQAQRRVLEA